MQILYQRTVQEAQNSQDGINPPALVFDQERTLSYEYVIRLHMKFSGENAEDNELILLQKIL